MSSRKRAASTTRTKSRYSNVLGYDRSRGGLQVGSRANLMAAQRAAMAAGRGRIEIKGVDIALTQTAVVATTGDGSNAVVLNLIPPGSGSWNRIGRKAELLSVRLRGTVQFTSTASPTGGTFSGNTLRMVVVHDQQPSGSQPAWDTIFGITPQSGTESSLVLAPLRYDNMERFRVLKDVVISNDCVQSPTSATGAMVQFYPFDCFVPLKGIVTTYSGQTATQTIADISTGAVYVYFRALRNTSAASTTPGASVDVDAGSFARLRFRDA